MAGFCGGHRGFNRFRVAHLTDQNNIRILAQGAFQRRRKGRRVSSHFPLADDAFVVTNPEVSSVRDSDRMLGILASKSYRAEQNLEPIKEYLLLTRYSPERVKLGEMLSVEDVQDILSLHLLGVIPESKSVLNASNSGTPVILDEVSDAGQAYGDIVARYLGENRPHRFIDDKKGFFRKFFGSKQ